MMKALLKNLHIFILLYGGYIAYEKYVEIEEKKEQTIQRKPILENKIKKLKKKRKDIRSFLSSIEEAKKNIERVAIEVEKIQKKLPSNVSDANNLDLIKKVAESLSIKNVYLSPGDEEDKGFYITKKYKFRGNGTFLQFLIFLEKLSDTEQLLNVGEIKIEESGKKQRGRFQVINFSAIVEAYKYNEGHKEDRGFDKIERQIKEAAKKVTRPKKNRRRKK